jgi:hypothetical protein
VEEGARREVTTLPALTLPMVLVYANSRLSERSRPILVEDGWMSADDDGGDDDGNDDEDEADEASG